MIGKHRRERVRIRPLVHQDGQHRRRDGGELLGRVARGNNPPHEETAGSEQVSDVAGQRRISQHGDAAVGGAVGEHAEGDEILDNARRGGGGEVRQRETLDELRPGRPAPRRRQRHRQIDGALGEHHARAGGVEPELHRVVAPQVDPRAGA